ADPHTRQHKPHSPHPIDPLCLCLFFFQAEDGIRDRTVTGVQTCALPISESPSSTLLAPVHRSPEKMSELSWSRFPRPFLTTSMNCLWISSSIDCAWRFCFSSTGENGSRKALFSPEVRARRSTPSFSMVPVKPQPSMITPIDPMMLALST